MDYTKQNLSFKIKKSLRYIFLYGIQRTLVKIKGQYHMKKHYRSFPREKPLSSKTVKDVACIGCGNYTFSNIAYYLKKEQGDVVRACMDIDIHKAASLFEHYRLQYYTDDVKKIIADPEINLVYIASNHASHTDYAIACIGAGKHVHIEKPHVVSVDQLNRLVTTMERNSGVKVFLGYNRPKNRLFRKLQDVLSNEKGTVMVNWFVAGHEIPDDHWYFNEKEGGRVLGNLCHWTDLTLHLISIDKAFPCTISSATPIEAKSDFVVSMVFGDQSCATITFSAKGHTFEGVREVLNLHKGNVLANITDFQNLSIDIMDKRIKTKLIHRDHGHKENIIHSYDGSRTSEISGESITHIKATAMFYLAIKQAIDTRESVILTKDGINTVK